MSNESQIVALTPRQREVLALLSKGFTQPEIAGLLDVKAGTVKKHVAEILDRFGVSNSTEAVVTYLNQEFLYGEDGYGHDFYIQEARVGIELDKNLKDGLFRSDLKLIALRDRNAKVEGSFYCDGNIESIKSFGDPIVPTRSERGRVFFRSDYSHDIQQGDLVCRNMVISMTDAFVNVENYWALEQSHPCAILKFFIKFPAGTDLRFQRIREFGNHSDQVADHRSECMIDGEYVWTINEPKIGAFYTIRWKNAANGDRLRCADRRD